MDLWDGTKMGYYTPKMVYHVQLRPTSCAFFKAKLSNLLEKISSENSFLVNSLF